MAWIQARSLPLIAIRACLPALWLWPRFTVASATRSVFTMVSLTSGPYFNFKIPDFQVVGLSIPSATVRYPMAKRTKARRYHSYKFQCLCSLSRSSLAIKVFLDRLVSVVINIIRSELIGSHYSFYLRFFQHLFGHHFQTGPSFFTWKLMSLGTTKMCNRWSYQRPGFEKQAKGIHWC